MHLLAQLQRSRVNNKTVHRKALLIVCIGLSAGPAVGQATPFPRHLAKLKEVVRSSLRVDAAWREPFWRQPHWKSRLGESVLISTMINMNGSAATAAALGFVPALPILGVYEVVGAAVGFAYPNLAPAMERVFNVVGKNRVPSRLAPVLHAGVRAGMINVIGAVGSQALLNVPPDLAIALIFQGASMSTSLSYDTLKRGATRAASLVHRQLRKRRDPSSAATREDNSGTASSSTD